VLYHITMPETLKEILSNGSDKVLFKTLKSVVETVNALDQSFQSEGLPENFEIYKVYKSLNLHDILLEIIKRDLV
jgi:hypothetical protein